jgi:hypothetical protein
MEWKPLKPPPKEDVPVLLLFRDDAVGPGYVWAGRRLRYKGRWRWVTLDNDDWDVSGPEDIVAWSPWPTPPSHGRAEEERE